MNTMLQMALRLSLITTLAGLGLGGVYSVTKNRIDEADAARTAAALTKVLPGYQVDPAAVQKVGPIQYWVGEAEDGSPGFAFIALQYGYSSEIKTMVGVDHDLKIQGVEVLFQQETPGLGARVQEVLSNAYFIQWLTGNLPEQKEPQSAWFGQQFVGLEAEQIDVRKGLEWHSMTPEQQSELQKQNAISALSGATITSRAVADSISNAAKQVVQAVSDQSGQTTQPSESQTQSDSKVEPPSSSSLPGEEL